MDRVRRRLCQKGVAEADGHPVSAPGGGGGGGPHPAPGRGLRRLRYPGRTGPHRRADVADDADEGRLARLRAKYAVAGEVLDEA